jgi:hypothetical protein
MATIFSPPPGAFSYLVFDRLHKVLPQNLFLIINNSEKRHSGNNKVVGDRNGSTATTIEDS